MTDHKRPEAQASFFNLHRHGFVRVAAAVPVVALSAPGTNAGRIAALVKEGAHQHVSVMVFPELCLSGYSNEDLFFQDILLSDIEAALEEICTATREFNTLFFIGAPLMAAGGLYNCAIACQRGEILGVIPKSYLPNYREFYEKRYFRSGLETGCDHIFINDVPYPFGTDLLFCEEGDRGVFVHAEICEDLWVPTPPSSAAALAGASILVNLSASNATLGKSDKRHALCAVQSMRCYSAYLYAAAGHGESTTDLAWDGQAMIYENGILLGENERFAPQTQMLIRDIDLGLLRAERLRSNSFGDNQQTNSLSMRRISFDAGLNLSDDLGLYRVVERFPYVPSNEAKLAELCEEAYQIQVTGLAQRLESAGIDKLVIGISGGLDSTQALLVACRTMDRLNLPRTNILAFTLPAFATGRATKENARALMTALGVQAEEIDLRVASRQMLRDINHPAANDAEQPDAARDHKAQDQGTQDQGAQDQDTQDQGTQFDLTYENVQAGARTSILFRLANHHQALVLGTGDLSELALGWCTYGVGDHMSHYNVNAAVSKTLIQHLIRWVIREDFFGQAAGNICLRILDTDISPELIPAAAGEGGAPVQLTEESIGPYALQDFNLHHISRYGAKPSKVAFLAYHAWHDASSGRWPPHMKEADRRSYGLDEIRKWLRVFLFRFFQTSQFKRSALPNGPKMSSAGALSPRGDWRAPSDGSAAIWLAELERNVPESEA